MDWSIEVFRLKFRLVLSSSPSSLDLFADPKIETIVGELLSRLWRWQSIIKV